MMVIFGVLGVIIMASIVYVLWRNPAWALSVYALTLPFGSSITVPGGIPPPFNTMTTLLGAVTGGILISRMVMFHRVSRSIPPSVYLLAIFVAVSGITYAWSIDPASSVDEFWILISLIGLHATAAHYLFTAPDLKTVEAGVVAGGAFTGLFGLYLLAIGGMPTTGAGVPRFEITGGGGGEGGDPNITAAAMLLPFAVGLFHSLDNSKGWIRTLYFLATVATGFGILLTASRGGILAATFAMFVVVAASGYRKLGTAIVVLALVGAFFLLPGAITERVDNTGSSGRTDIWRVGLLACPTHCLVGSGIGTFADVHEQFFLTEPASGGNKIRYQAHNIWLQLAVETGIVTVLLFAVAVLMIHHETRVVPRAQRGAARGALWAVMLANLFLSSLSFKYFWMTLTYAAIVTTVAMNRGMEGPAAPSRDSAMRIRSAAVATGAR